VVRCPSVQALRITRVTTLPGVWITASGYPRITLSSRNRRPWQGKCAAQVMVRGMVAWTVVFVLTFRLPFSMVTVSVT
jgi:hypothetical protein